MQIRLFEPTDTETVADLLHDMSRHYNGERASSREVVRANLVDNILGIDSDVRLVLALTGDRAIGIAMISILYPAPKERAQLFMKELYVASASRSQGVGRHLMEWIADYAVTRNCIRFDWTVDSHNIRAVEFYRSIGATHVTEKLYFRFAGSDLKASRRDEMLDSLTLLRTGLSRADSSGRDVLYRYLTADDFVDEITAMLHEAYGPLAAAGMRFVASHQDSAMTRRRLDHGDTIVAVDQGRIVGIVTLARADATGGAPFYDSPDVASFGQFAVRPSHQRRGIGRTLLGLVEDRARALGVRHLALDTSELAADLIAFYESLGFHIVARHRWSTVNYESVIMAKDLAESRSHDRP